MQNGAIWDHFRVSYSIESSTILMTSIEFLKIVQNLPIVSTVRGSRCCAWKRFSDLMRRVSSS